MNKKLLIILFFILFFFSAIFSPALALTQKEEETTVKTTPIISSLEKSLLIPGWGQLAEKRYLEGILFLSAEVFCFYKILSYNHLGNKNYELYKKAATVDDAVHYRQLTEKYDARRNQYLLTAAAVWAINLLDIYLIIQDKSKKERALQFKLESAENKKITLTASYRF